MTDILDSLDIIKNIEGVYESNSAFGVLKDFERVLDQLDLYVYDNWIDGELAFGPKISRHWITVHLFWPKRKKPDIMGARRLIEYDCKLKYRKAFMIKPKKVKTPDDFRPGTKKGKMERLPVWIVEIKMPKSLISDIYDAKLEDLDVQEPENETVAQPTIPDDVDSDTETVQ